MNALWINRIYEYKNTPLCLETAKKIIYIKTEREKILLRKYGKEITKTNIHDIKLTATSIFLYEARIARSFWREFRKLIPIYLGFPGREPHGNDLTNKLLDIGYHHLTNEVKKILLKYNIPFEVGILHIARNTTSAPLAYDLVEIFRSDIIDTEVLKFFRLKKKKIKKIDNQIAYFLSQVNKRLDRRYYLKELKACHNYRYYMELQILKFVKAINHKSIFNPVILPSRHEDRCA
jgi:CRISPR-associated endonuclease Cas1